MLAAVLIFFSADRMVRSSALYYISGTIVGMLASVLIILLALQKLVPRMDVRVLILDT